MTTHIMLDLETWGKKPGYDIRSIGACVFSLTTSHPDKEQLVHDGSLGTIKPFYIACDNPSKGYATTEYKYYDTRLKQSFKYNLKRDPETVAWWNDQSDEAKAAFNDPVDLHEALFSFSAWLASIVGLDINTNNLSLWSHGPAFDPPILAAAYDAVNLSVPWHYRSPRDTRTAFDLANVEDHSGFMGMFNTGTHHHALDDAICQAKAVCAAYRIIKGTNI